MSDLLEREHEVQAIDETLDAALAGDGRLLLVEAAAGLGKSTLLGDARRRAHDAAFEVLDARGRELEREFPFGVARQLFEARLRAARTAERRRLLQGSAALAAELLGLEAPGLERRPEHGSPFPVLHGLHWLAANLAERAPLALVVDDAHWADELSLRFVVYLAARLHDLPVAVFAARRPGEQGADGQLLAQLAAERAVRVVRPEALSEDATRRVVACRVPGADPAFSAACHRATAGNPFLLGELLVALEQEGVPPVAASAERVLAIGPEPVSRTVNLALGALPSEATAVARAVAVLGDGAPADHVAALARQPVETAGEATIALERANILRGDGGIAFVHPIVGRAIYEELDPAERAVAHRAAFRVLSSAGAPAERVAAHVLEARGGIGPDAAVVLRSAAADAVRRGAPASAIRYLRCALDEADEARRADVLLELGRAEAAAADPAAAERLRAAVAAAAGDPERRADLAGELGRLLYAQGAFAEAAATFDRALAELEPGRDPRRLALEAGWAAAALWSRSPVPEVRARIERLVERDADPATRAERELLGNVAGLEMLAAEDREAAIRHALRAWGGGALLEEGRIDDPAIWAVTGALAGSEAWAEVADVLEAVTAAARRAGAVQADATASYVRAYRFLCLGAVDDALAEIDNTLDARRHGWSTFVPAALWIRARGLLHRGDVAAAESCVTLDAEDASRYSGVPIALTLLDARARVRLAANEPAAALASWREAGAIAEAMGVRNPGFVPWRSGAALAAGRLGALDEARRLADADVAAARAYGAPRALGVALTARGTIERPERALRWLDEAVAVLEASPARLDLAEALVQRGTVLRVAGRRVDARGPLRRGLDLADRCGGRALAIRAREELVAAGGRPRRARLSGAAALTPSELRVARLVASGLSNRDVAEALFVTKKAVEFHLGNVYRKLEVAGREELGQALDGTNQ